MIFWLCSSIALSGALLATLAGDLRVAILALWVCGLSTGGIFLSLGAEFLAVVQWIVATLVAISFIFYAITFGEYGHKDKYPMSKKMVLGIVPALVGVSFVGVIWIGTRNIPVLSSFDAPVFESPSQGEGVQIEGTGANSIGKKLVENHLISIEILALMLFLTVIGSGVVARPEGSGN